MNSIKRFISSESSEKATLTKLAKVMDSAVNGTEFEGVVLRDVLEKNEIQEINNHIGELIMPYIIDEIK